jgi:hypothetical protein
MSTFTRIAISNSMWHLLALILRELFNCTWHSYLIIYPWKLWQLKSWHDNVGNKTGTFRKNQSYFILICGLYFPRDSIVGWGTMLQAGRFLVWFPIRSLDFFQFTYSFQLYYGPGVDSASNRNEYQESSLGAKSGWSVRLTTSQTSVSWLSRKCGSLDV